MQLKPGILREDGADRSRKSGGRSDNGYHTQRKSTELCCRVMESFTFFCCMGALEDYLCTQSNNTDEWRCFSTDGYNLPKRTNLNRYSAPVFTFFGLFNSFVKYDYSCKQYSRGKSQALLAR